MRKTIQIVFFLSFIFCLNSNVFGQEKTISDPDIQLKETLYNKFKKEVQTYDKKDFDTLFFDFFEKSNNGNTKLTKEEFYTYTIKIAIYSEKLGLLYKNQKEQAQKTKQEWFNKNYEDYLNSKK